MHGTDFQLHLFLIACVLNAAFWWTGVASKLIRMICSNMIRGYTRKWVQDHVKPPFRKEVLVLVRKEMRPSEHYMGKAVALIEETLYIFGAFAGSDSIISGVLLFKAFHTWIEGSGPPGEPAEPEERAAESTAPAQTLSTPERHFNRFQRSRERMLVRFYEYAIGNFISLGIAMFFFLLVTRVAAIL